MRRGVYHHFFLAECHSRVEDECLHGNVMATATRSVKALVSLAASSGVVYVTRSMVRMWSLARAPSERGWGGGS